jgi:fatty acid desaturase
MSATATTTTPAAAGPVAELPPNRFVPEAQAAVEDLQLPDMTRYWVDLMASVGFAHAALAVYLTAAPFSAIQLAAFLACGPAIFRAVAFTHELAHHRTPAFRTLSVAWNALCGVPFLVPSFMYGDHGNHHASRAYGTRTDPEYLLRGSGSPRRALVFLLLSAVYPLLPVARFLVLTPLSAVSARVNRFTWTRASSLYFMNESYRREYDPTAASAARWAQELLCSAWAWTLALLLATGRLPWPLALKTYLVMLLWVSINQVRTLAAHRYENGGVEPMTHLAQLLDTNTFPRGILPNLWAPLGLRYHALHHLMPGLPYHAMGQAHSRLMERLPCGSPYHRTVRPGLWPALASMLRPRSHRR